MRVRVLLAIGALASLATSYGGSSIEDRKPIVGAIGNHSPAVHFTLHAELASPGPFDELDGHIEAYVYVQARNAATSTLARVGETQATVSIELRSLSRPEEPSSIISVPIMFDRQLRTVDLPAWLACRGNPCEEEYELIVSRDPALDLPAIDITGYATVAAEWPDAAPHGSTVLVTVDGRLQRVVGRLLE